MCSIVCKIGIDQPIKTDPKMTIEWAPMIDVPLHRRLEVCAAAFQMYFTIFGEPVCAIIIALALWKGNIYIRTITICYLVFVYFDRDAGERGGRRAVWIRNWRVWKYFVAYFPADLIRTVELPPNRNYLFAIFPHGVLSTSVGVNFNNNYSKWATLFPGIRARILTLGYHMRWPLFREFVMDFGMASVSARSITTLLSQSNDKSDAANSDGFTSNAAMLLVGGAQEAIHARPGNHTLVLKKRKGFVKIALQTGAPLVPVYSFGEVELFRQVSNPPGSKLRRLQECCKRITGVAPVMANGRGLFQYSFGLVPYRRPLTTVVGAPIVTEKRENPTKAEVDELHAKFCQELINLFETHKTKYLENAENLKLVLE